MPNQQTRSEQNNEGDQESSLRSSSLQPLTNMCQTQAACNHQLTASGLEIGCNYLRLSSQITFGSKLLQRFDCIGLLAPQQKIGTFKSGLKNRENKTMLEKNLNLMMS